MKELKEIFDNIVKYSKDISEDKEIRDFYFDLLKNELILKGIIREADSINERLKELKLQLEEIRNV